MYFDIFKDIIDKVFKDKIPTDRTPFSINLNLGDTYELREREKEIYQNDPNYFQKLQLFTDDKLSTDIQKYLLREDYIKLIPNNTFNQVQLTDKGIEAKSFGTIELYLQHLKDQRDFERQLVKSTIATNQSVQDTNSSTLKNYTNTQKISIGSIVVAFASVIVSSIALFKENGITSKQLQPILEKNQQAIDSLLKHQKDSHVVVVKGLSDTLIFPQRRH